VHIVGAQRVEPGLPMTLRTVLLKLRADPAAPSPTQLMLAKCVVGLCIVLVLAGLAAYGLSGEVQQRIWQNLLDRPGGELAFRFLLQPSMAALAALRAGIADAHAGRAPFLWALITGSQQRAGLLDEALIATARIMLLGLVMDLIYQVIVFDDFHPAEAVIVALGLAFVPYVLMRGLVTRVARRWVGGAASGVSR
jgi:hypothetical protein